MSSDRKKLVEARQLINLLSRTCRQTLTYMNGISCLDQRRIKQILQDAVARSEKFIGS